MSTKRVPIMRVLLPFVSVRSRVPCPKAMLARASRTLSQDSSGMRMRGSATGMRHASSWKQHVRSVDLYGIELKARAELPLDVIKMVPALLAADAAVLKLWEDSGPKRETAFGTFFNATRFLNQHGGYASLHAMSTVIVDLPLPEALLEFELRTKHKKDLAPMLNVYVQEMCKVGGSTHYTLRSLNFKQIFTGEMLSRGDLEARDVMHSLKKDLDACTKRLVWPPDDVE